MHGRHATCFVGGSALLQWPCTAKNSQSIPSYRGYDYVADVIASHGYVVVSVSANGVNAVDNSVFDLGALARAELLQKHLDILKTFNTTGGAPFGAKFVGKLDLSRVGTMGHSRGGEGVVRHKRVERLVRRALRNQSRVSVRAGRFQPVRRERRGAQRPAAVLRWRCERLARRSFLRDARYNVPGDHARNITNLVMGANHNFYNTIWSPSSQYSWCGKRLAVCARRSVGYALWKGKGNQRLTEAQQRGTGLAYMTAFFRAYVGGENQFIPILTGDAPPPPSAQTNNLFVSYHAPDSPALRRDVNRLLNNTNLTVNTLGAAATQTGLTPYELCGGEAPQPATCLPGQPNARQPHTTPSVRSPCEA